MKPAAFAVLLSIAISGCGRSAANVAEPTPTPTGVFVEGKPPAVSATIRVAGSNENQFADFKVSVYAPRKMADDDGGVMLPQGELGQDLRSVAPGFLCRDFSAATDAVVPVIWEMKTGDGGAGALSAPLLDLTHSVVNRSNLRDYGISNIQKVGLTGECEGLTSGGSITFLGDWTGFAHRSESFESGLIVLKGYFSEAHPEGSAGVVEGLQMVVTLPASDSWVSRLSGSPNSSLRSLKANGCNSQILIPLTANPTTTEEVTPFACPEIQPTGSRP